MWWTSSLGAEFDIYNQNADRVLNVKSKIYKQTQYYKIKPVNGQFKSGNGQLVRGSKFEVWS